MPPSQSSSEVWRLIEQGRVRCLCGRKATGTTAGGEPECDDGSCYAAEEVDRLRNTPGAEDTIRRAYRSLTNISNDAVTGHRPGGSMRPERSCARRSSPMADSAQSRRGELRDGSRIEDGQVYPSPSGSELTDDERRAIASLKRLAKRWPDTLALWGGLGDIIVIRTHDGALSDENDLVHHIDSVKIPSGGGDPDWYPDA